MIHCLINRSGNQVLPQGILSSSVSSVSVGLVLNSLDIPNQVPNGARLGRVLQQPPAAAWGRVDSACIGARGCSLPVRLARAISTIGPSTEDVCSAQRACYKADVPLASHLPQIGKCNRLFGRYEATDH